MCDELKNKEAQDKNKVECAAHAGEKKDSFISIQDVMKLDLRIAEVIAAENHPNADRLLVLKIKVGDEERQLVAGIRKAYTAESLIGKKIVIVANLEPAVLRGVESQGMLLAASADDSVVLIAPENNIVSGARVK
jgi:methionyl-tRNA synthetase